MQYFIDPTIDFVFKLILGTPGNENMLIDFINQIINPVSPIISVTYINPYNDKQYKKDKYSVVDIKAIDQNGIKYQIEIQLTEPSFLPARMLYTWSSIYHTQAVKGLQFDVLKPVISIWLLTGSIFKDDDKCHHKFGIWDKDNNVQLTDHCDIHVIELAKWKIHDRLQLTEYWLYFFKEAKNWKHLPAPLKSLAIMRQAMKTLEEISTNEDEYLAYLARQDQIMIERTLQSQLKEAQEIKKEAQEIKKEAQEIKKVAAEQQKASAEQLKKMQQMQQNQAVAEAEKAQLLKLLKQAGIDPNIT